MSTPLVNTSLPARTAVPLPPATLASLTGNPSSNGTGFLRSIRVAPAPASQHNAPSVQHNAPSVQSFAPASQNNAPVAQHNAPAVQPSSAPKAIWASLAAKWGQEQKEEEERRRQENQQLSALQSAQRLQMEQEEKERSRLGITRVLMNPRQTKTLLDEEEEERRRRLERLAAEEDAMRWAEDDADGSAGTEYVQDVEHRRKGKHDL